MHLVWWGDSETEFGWLLERCTAYLQLPGKPVRLTLAGRLFCADQALELARQGVQLQIVAIRNRWDFPLQQLIQFQRWAADVPTALALSDWHWGYGRTGIGHGQSIYGTQGCWPNWYWHQWDLAWVPWLRSAAARSEKDGLVDLIRPPSRALVITGALATSEAWQERLSHAVVIQIDGDRLTPEQLQSPTLLGDSALLEKPESIVPPRRLDRCPAWLVWDDSRLPTCRGWQACLERLCEELQVIRRLFPKAELRAAMIRPSWQVQHCLDALNLNCLQWAKA